MKTERHKSDPTVDNFDTLRPAVSFRTLLTIFLALAAGEVLILVAPASWLAGLSNSLLGSEPHAFWYLSRSSAFVAYALLWLSMALGLSITNKLARLWPGGPAAFDLHQYTSLLGMGFALFHALILLGDRYIGYTLAELLIPFGSVNYDVVAVALGQIGMYVMIVVTFSFYARRTIGQRAWRLIHYASFLMFVLALGHGIWSGSDSGTLWAMVLYWGSGLSLVGLLVYRVLVAGRKKPVPAAAHSKTAVRG